MVREMTPGDVERLREYHQRKNAPPYPVIPQGPPPDERGEAWEEPLHAKNGKAPPGTASAEPDFPAPIPASKLRKLEDDRNWLWHGYLSRGSITLLSALWKVGKSTLLAYLLRALREDGLFCDLRVQKARVLYVTEESETRWARRRDVVGLADNVEFLVRPFLHKPNWPDWFGLLAYIRKMHADAPYDLIVFDTLTNLWPVDKENDAPQVQTALQPLHGMGENVSQLLVHHMKKGDGLEATASRGSGALTAFVDTILELRRYDAGEAQDCRRTLRGYGRDEETFDELVVELTDGGYVTHGDRVQSLMADLSATVASILPTTPPGMTSDEILGRWPGKARPNRNRFFSVLRAGLESGFWSRIGEGKRGDPYTYYASSNPPPAFQYQSQPLRGSTDTETSEPFPTPFDSD